MTELNPDAWPTDKVHLGYLPAYERIRDELYAAFVELGIHQRIPGDHDTRVLEVGVAGGGGMHMFRDLFESPTVYGVDLNPLAGYLDDRGVNILTASQDDPGLPLVIESRWGTFHLIVDDASHLAGPTSVALSNLWPLVKPGGFYVIEDWNYLEAGGMAQNLWQKLFGTMLAYPSVDLREKPPPPYSGMLPDVADVTVRDGMIIIRKAVRDGTAQ